MNDRDALIEQAEEWIAEHDFGHPTAEGIIRKLIAALASPSPATDHSHCSAGCEKAQAELRCFKCGAPWVGCTPDICDLGDPAPAQALIERVEARILRSKAMDSTYVTMFRADTESLLSMVSPASKGGDATFTPVTQSENAYEDAPGDPLPGASSPSPEQWPSDEQVATAWNTWMKCPLPGPGAMRAALATLPPPDDEPPKAKGLDMPHPGPLAHKDACALGLYFNRAASLSNPQHYRINEWLKALIFYAPGNPHPLAPNVSPPPEDETRTIMERGPKTLDEPRLRDVLKFLCDAHEELMFDLRPVLEFGPNHNQAIKDGMARIGASCDTISDILISRAPQGVTGLERSRVLEAARLANYDHGQWMPQAWLELFMKRYAALASDAVLWPGGQ